MYRIQSFDCGEWVNNMAPEADGDDIDVLKELAIEWTSGDGIHTHRVVSGPSSDPTIHVTYRRRTIGGVVNVVEI
jgi:hypothetical protein